MRNGIGGFTNPNDFYTCPFANATNTTNDNAININNSDVDAVDGHVGVTDPVVVSVGTDDEQSSISYTTSLSSVPLSIPITNEQVSSSLSSSCISTSVTSHHTQLSSSHMDGLTDMASLPKSSINQLACLPFAFPVQAPLAQLQYQQEAQKVHLTSQELMHVPVTVPVPIAKKLTPNKVPGKRKKAPGKPKESTQGQSGEKKSSSSSSSSSSLSSGSSGSSGSGSSGGSPARATSSTDGGSSSSSAGSSGGSSGSSISGEIGKARWVEPVYDRVDGKKVRRDPREEATPFGAIRLVIVQYVDGMDKDHSFEWTDGSRVVWAAVATDIADLYLWYNKGAVDDDPASKRKRKAISTTSSKGKGNKERGPKNQVSKDLQSFRTPCHKIETYAKRFTPASQKYNTKYRPSDWPSTSIPRGKTSTSDDDDEEGGSVASSGGDDTNENVGIFPSSKKSRGANGKVINRRARETKGGQHANCLTAHGIMFYATERKTRAPHQCKRGRDHPITVYLRDELYPLLAHGGRELANEPICAELISYGAATHVAPSISTSSSSSSSSSSSRVGSSVTTPPPSSRPLRSTSSRSANVNTTSTSTSSTTTGSSTKSIGARVSLITPSLSSSSLPLSPSPPLLLPIAATTKAALVNSVPTVVQVPVPVPVTGPLTSSVAPSLSSLASPLVSGMPSGVSLGPHTGFPMFMPVPNPNAFAFMMAPQQHPAASIWQPYHPHPYMAMMSQYMLMQQQQQQQSSFGGR
jgi:hypothetical protein